MKNKNEVRDGLVQFHVSCGSCGSQYDQSIPPGKVVYCCGVCGYRGRPRGYSTMVTRPVCRLEITELTS